MLNNTPNNSSCAFGEQIVSYLYGEVDARDKSIFETHIKTCPSCAGEFADFEFVRDSVIEWRDVSFSNLATPVFDFTPNENFATDSKEEKHSWIAEIKKLFSFRPAFVMAGLAILVFGAGLILFMANFSKTEVVAEFDKNEAQKTIASPTIEKAVAAPILKPIEKSTESKVDNVSSEVVQQPRVTPGKAPVKVSTRSEENSSPARENKETKIRDKKSVAPKQKLPNLIEEENNEDKSIRLADLFEEIGTE